MKVVLIGDIGWRHLYHLGDEAMTEAAIDMLRKRGIDDVTLVAGEPDYAEELYGLPAVRRVRFRGDWSRARNEWRLQDVARVLSEQDWGDHPIYPAIRDADAVIIAGGGNMNSRDYHLLFERVAAKRIAEHFGTPLYVTSQTVGPVLTDEDRALVVEIADYARVFGCRESVTADLMRRHVARPELVHQTLDDAAMLSADEPARAAALKLAGERPFAVASFTWHAGDTWGSVDTYYSDLADLSRTIAERHDLDVLLVPHAGSLHSDALTRDLESNAQIAQLAGSDRVRATRMVTAREDVALLELAALSISTRYHPTVFAPMVETPAVAFAPSYYSIVRMTGSLGNVGLERFVLPPMPQTMAHDAIAEALDHDTDLASHAARARAHAVEFQNRWWDALGASIASDSGVEFSGAPAFETYEPRGEWSARNQAIAPVYAELSQVLSDTLRTAAALEEEGDRLRRELQSTRSELERYKNRRIIRLLDRRRT